MRCHAVSSSPLLSQRIKRGQRTTKDVAHGTLEKKIMSATSPRMLKHASPLLQCKTDVIGESVFPPDYLFTIPVLQGNSVKKKKAAGLKTPDIARNAEESLPRLHMKFSSTSHFLQTERQSEPARQSIARGLFILSAKKKKREDKRGKN